MFVNGPYVMGFTSSFRMGQLLRYALSPPAPESSDLHGFMCTAFVDALRACLKDGGWAKKESEQETGGQFLVGVVSEAADPYAAVGCGAAPALGALFATAAGRLGPRERLDGALKAAERFSNGVRGPYVVAVTP